MRVNYGSSVSTTSTRRDVVDPEIHLSAFHKSNVTFSILTQHTRFYWDYLRSFTPPRGAYYLMGHIRSPSSRLPNSPPEYKGRWLDRDRLVVFVVIGFGFSHFSTLLGPFGYHFRGLVVGASLGRCPWFMRPLQAAVQLRFLTDDQHIVTQHFLTKKYLAGMNKFSDR